MNSQYPRTRLRRLRNNQTIRALVSETNFNPEKLILPLFIKHGQGVKTPIASMPGQYQWSVDQLPTEINHLVQLGVRAVILFGIPEHKDALGQDSYSANGIIQQAIRCIKSVAPTMFVITDVCLCEYTDHGHCGVIHSPEQREAVVDNDESIALLAKQAVSHAQAGADMVAPSANMDGMVFAIREALDSASFESIPILSYSTKYASSLYGPFRLAAEGAPQFGDRQTYQMDYRNAEEALKESALDIEEGADILMVKPAHAYLDIICRVKTAFPQMPLCAYHTSGEFAMLKAAAEKGWLNEQAGVMEVLTAIQRAGADMIITYYTKEVLGWLKAGT